MDLLMIVLPAFLIFLTGYIGQKWIGFDIKSISMAALYLMSPFLAFRTFYANELTMEYVYITVFCLILSFALIIVVLITGFFMKATRQKMSAMILGGVFMNSGNYGAPVVLFAFGAAGFDYAVIIMVFQAFLMNTIGLFAASFGGEEETSLQQSLRRVARMPVLHGAILGVVLQLLNVHIPPTFMDAISLVADASIPTVMLVLGMQLAVIATKRVAYKYVNAVAVIRMIVSPLLAVAIVAFIPVNDLLKDVMILLAAMPAAANTTMFAIQYGTEPDLVSFTTLITTLLSIVTIPLVLFWLGI
ncbi:AEC family transporter [Domibacillus sp. A3M-37]|uniref:AEC family transporter n=1 Tax=Domibacillus TaxID=1433999 RepID=UPI000617EFE6|nr:MULTISPECIES: AEC family transporter [Domibacillus]MCP3762940.1 AEC family transporter [Domibacillus sp. A3M-37]